MDNIKEINNTFNTGKFEANFTYLRDDQITLSSQNGSNFSTKEIIFNTSSIASKLISYLNSYFLFTFYISYTPKTSDTTVKNILETIQMKFSNYFIDSFKVLINNQSLCNTINGGISNGIKFLLDYPANGSYSQKNLHLFNSKNWLKYEDFSLYINDTQDLDKKIDKDAKYNFFIQVPVYLDSVHDVYSKDGALNFLSQKLEYHITLTLTDDIFISEKLNENDIFNFNVVTAQMVVREVKLNNKLNELYLEKMSKPFTRRLVFKEYKTQVLRDVGKGIYSFIINNIADIENIYFFGIVNKDQDGGIWHNKAMTKKLDNIIIFLNNNLLENNLLFDHDWYDGLRNKTKYNEQFILDIKKFSEYYNIYSFNIRGKIEQVDSYNNSIRLDFTLDTEEICNIYAVWDERSDIKIEYNPINGINVEKLSKSNLYSEDLILL